MAKVSRMVGGCLLLPALLIGGCYGKVYVDNVMYNLPGPILASSAAPTQRLGTAISVAETLDTYVQPRFHILRDKNFGAFRIVYRRHAGVGQLKVESEREKELIANVNASKRDYAIGLLHCNVARQTEPRLDLLYFNQEKLISDWTYANRKKATEVSAKNGLPFEKLEKKARGFIAPLLQGKECRTSQQEWEVLMRPVRASARKCVSCHEGTKLGDTLGVMVYAVRKATRQVASSEPRDFKSALVQEHPLTPAERPW